MEVLHSRVYEAVPNRFCLTNLYASILNKIVLLLPNLLYLGIIFERFYTLYSKTVRVPILPNLIQLYFGKERFFLAKLLSRFKQKYKLFNRLAKYLSWPSIQVRPQFNTHLIPTNVILAFKICSIKNEIIASRLVIWVPSNKFNVPSSHPIISYLMCDLLNYRTFGLKNEVVHHLFILSVAGWKDQLMGVIAYKNFPLRHNHQAQKLVTKVSPARTPPQPSSQYHVSSS